MYNKDASKRYRENKKRFVRLNSWITQEQNKLLKKVAKRESISEAQIVRSLFIHLK